MATHRLTYDNIRPEVRNAQYAVRGELAIKAEEFKERLDKGDKSLPFDNIIFANIGNPQQLGQKPITFFRQVLSILEYPALLDNEEALKSTFGFKQDVIDRAKRLLQGVQTVGAYSHSQGAPLLRESVAKFLERRDGFPADAKDIFLTGGASSGVNTLLTVICENKSSGVLVPIPQYPLYTATLSLLNAHYVPYYLEEGKAWGTDVNTIRESVTKAKAEGIDVRAIVVINPGNPTGASLSPDDIKSVLDFAVEERLVIMADEVYQTNVFIGEHTSFKKRLRQLQQEVAGKYDNIELVSLHSVSKGMVGECGHRGGYFELVNFDPEVQAQIYKFISIMLCPSVIGQCLVEMMVNPPKQGEPSFELYNEEYNGIKNGLKQRAFALYEAFKKMEGVDCQEPQVPLNPFLLLLLSLSYTNIILGCHVPLPHHHPPRQSHIRRRSRRQKGRRILLSRTAGRHGHLRRSRVWVWTKGRHAAFPDDIFGAWDGVGAKDYQVSWRVYG
jgi:alanine transaminase